MQVDQCEMPFTVACPECDQQAKVFNVKTEEEERPVIRCQRCGTYREGLWLPVQKGDLIEWKGRRFPAPRDYPHVITGIALEPRGKDAQSST